MSSTERRHVYRQKTMGYFINAAIKIIDEEGLSSLSIRKTAELAGYNSATLYHYFSDFDELCIFAAIKFLDEYAKDLRNYLSSAQYALEKYFKVWECFCFHSYTHPDIFWLLFFKNRNKQSDFSSFFREYYEIFPETWDAEVAEYSSMLTSDDLFQREYIALTKSLLKADIHVPEQTIFSINTMNLLIYRGMLETLREDPQFMPVDKAVDTTISYLKKTLNAYGIQ